MNLVKSLHMIFNGFVWSFSFLYSTLLHLPLLRFICAGGCWDQNQDCCDFCIDSQMFIHNSALSHPQINQLVPPYKNQRLFLSRVYTFHTTWKEYLATVTLINGCCFTLEKRLIGRPLISVKTSGTIVCPSIRRIWGTPCSCRHWKTTNLKRLRTWS